MLSLYFSGACVPEWLELYSADPRSPEKFVPPEVKFGTLCLIVHYKAAHWIWGIGNGPIMKVHNGRYFVMFGGKPIHAHTSIISMVKAMYHYEPKNLL
jgi:hypothetical protein